MGSEDFKIFVFDNQDLKSIMNDFQKTLGTEEQLLITLCGIDINNYQKENIRSNIEIIKDWDKFVYLANQHGVIALCSYIISDAGCNKMIPLKNRTELHSAFMKTLVRNTFLYQFMISVVHLANKEGIKIVLLKGLALERTVYGNKGLRQMNDIDILVHRHEAATLRRILMKNGFETVPLVSMFHERIMPAYGKHLPEMYKKGISVEIHFKLFDQVGNSLTEALYEKATRVPGDYTDLFFPEPQLFFLYLVKHLDRHEREGFFQLRLYTDLIYLLRYYFQSIITQELFAYAAKANLEKPIIEKLKILEVYWGIVFPDWVIQKTDRVSFEELTENFKRIIRQPENIPHAIERDSLIKLLKDVPGWSDRLLLLLGHVFPSLAYMKHKYKIKTSTVAVLYYPVRWFKQAVKIIKGEL